ncbi:hypothetical protein B1992_10415 [Pseudoxanthomonas broegbernensis]|uniref:Uncharacterized protein n=1 Tax=Pseudoxanthomonas broegbernensis TaxID=83619 RepID=A0A7V8K6Y5_9GAMM|nr:hypothetical protein [Pseudoxanthomonas broegbernensis]KAF1685878.1 hypothetical protein B1992_10415 [Pseudoxanthomonas broegbernensis]MBB6064099.1 hypothetical protein [Pseudoxanthomonas broegbernensis]
MILRRPEPHPLLVAALLAAGTQTRVAKAMGVRVSTLNTWTRRPTVPLEWLTRLAEVSAMLIHERKRELTNQLAAKPSLAFTRDFAAAVDDLDAAHRLRFRRRLVGGEGVVRG